VSRGNLAQARLGVSQHGGANTFAPPVRAQEADDAIRVDAILLLVPPDAVVADDFAVHLGKEHVGLRVAAGQVTVIAADIVECIAALDLVGMFAGFDDGQHFGEVALPGESAKGQAGDGGRFRQQNIFRDG
jgi:hypothetical protein